MTFDRKKQELCAKIEAVVLPLLTADYVLWGLPYYDNPGDTLIWEGTLELLKKSDRKCLGVCPWDEYPEGPIPTNAVILILGGGFFGDIWRPAWERVMEALERHPDNPAVVLPQSIYYDDLALSRSDAHRLAAIKDLVICARDTESYAFAARTFPGRIMLVPDMAFYADAGKLRAYALAENGRRLYLARSDKESPSVSVPPAADLDRRDWPSMSGGKSFKHRLWCKVARNVKRYAPRARRAQLLAGIFERHVKDVVLRDAVRFLSVYSEICTTRLHVMILALFLGKRVRVIDNRYGKLSGCCETWLKGCDEFVGP